MRKVLHVGPCDTPGGMATVMHTLADHPPEGWEANLLPSHAPGGLWSKWSAYRQARRELKRRCNTPSLRPDVVHVHTAADWSWWRKARLIQEVQSQNIAVVVHFHSGQFDAWLAKGGARRAQQVNRVLSSSNTRGVVLSSAWEERLQPMVGAVEVVGNPYRSLDASAEIGRDNHHLLLLARKDPVKGHAFAVKVAENLRQEFPNLRLTMTGESHSEHDWVDAVGWVSEEEKTTLLARASILLLPSAFEGQPMAALEALSAGLPVCVSDRVVGLPATVKQARWNDVEAWTAAVREMLLRPTEASTLQSSVADHTIERVQQRWGSVYDTLR
ncbi:MAG: glycosyltransferase family 4 protein [Candidatus Thermoplasmatota archaeon]|nr:glycosyltransferase family 4 protein [Candidatus Thermoplasmatota archaeon]